MENCSGKCDHCGGCGKNRVENRIIFDTGEKEISNRDLVCRDCTYKKRGDTLSCYKYEKKPEEILKGDSCEFYLKADVMGNSSSCDGNCKNCKNK